jgi:hypothetical protein
MPQQNARQQTKDVRRANIRERVRLSPKILPDPSSVLLRRILFLRTLKKTAATCLLIILCTTKWIYLRLIRHKITLYISSFRARC